MSLLNRILLSSPRVFCSAILYATGVVMVYILCLAVYRLCFHPLKSIPGSTWTIATGWYESYCELFKDGGGRFTMEIHKWHQLYGPIIRINPQEIHVNDPEFYDTIYATNAQREKLKAFETRFNTPHATFSTTEHTHHRTRRGALNPFFSRARVLDFVPRFQDHVARLCDRLDRDFRGQKRVLVVSDALVCVTTDVILDYAFDVRSRLIDGPDFEDQFATAIRDLQRNVHYLTAFPWLVSVLNLVPERWVENAVPVLRSVFAFRRTLSRLILESKERASSPKPGRSSGRTQPIVFDELLQSNLPPSELSTARLQDEALSIVGAGLESTRWAASVAIFHILDQPATHQRLKEELEAVVPEEGPLPRLTVLESLPWLAACVQEALRLAYGTVSRSPRLSPTPLVYGSYVIPAGTPISCETYSMHHNERLYPDSWAFQPERWVKNPDIKLSPDATPTKLSRYMTAFGRGSRMCLGMYVAEAELYMILAALFRRFELELFETDRTAVDCVKTALGPLPKDGTKGVRVMVS